MLKRVSALLLLVLLEICMFACAKNSPGGLNPGTYTGTGTGHGGAMEVRLRVGKDGRIAALEVISESETPEYAAEALDVLPESIVKQQSLGADAVAGATLTSRGLLDAAADAIMKAGGNPKDYGFVPTEEEAREIRIVGLPGGDVSVTNEQLRTDYEITERDAVSINSKGTKRDVHAKGVLLKTILQKHGAALADFDLATASASDGYTITIPEDVLHGRDILIAFEADGEAVAPRFVVPEERAMYWIKILSEITLEAAARETPVAREITLGELLEKLNEQTMDYKHNSEACKALPISVLLEEIGAPEIETVTMRAEDGLVKTEKYDVFAQQMLVIEGTDEAPLYTGADLPAGMRVKRIESIQIGHMLVKMD